MKTVLLVFLLVIFSGVLHCLPTYDDTTDNYYDYDVETTTEEETMRKDPCNVKISDCVPCCGDPGLHPFAQCKRCGFDRLVPDFLKSQNS